MFLCKFCWEFIFKTFKVLIAFLKILVSVSDTLRALWVLAEFPSAPSPSQRPRGTAALRRVPQVPTLVSDFLEALRVLAEFVKAFTLVANFFGTSVPFLIIYKLLNTYAASICYLLSGTQRAHNNRETIFEAYKQPRSRPQRG